MSEDLSITIFTFAVPCLFGVLLAIIVLIKKYDTDVKYVYYSLSTWIYILLSCALSVVLTLTLEAMGARVVTNALWNSIFMGIVGPGILFGIISTFTYPGPSNTDAGNQLKTLQDHVYDILDRLISRKTLEIVEFKINSNTVDINPESVMREVRSILDAQQDLTTHQKNQLIAKLDKDAQDNDYAPIIRELKKYHDIDYIIKRLSPETEQKYIQSKLRRLVRIALATHELGEDASPEFVIAKVQALQKAPDSSLYHLKQALQRTPSLKEHILTNKADWWILASMTHGEMQQKKLETLLSLMNVKQLAIEDIKKQCMYQSGGSVKVMATKKKNGDCVEITLKEVQNGQSHAMTWKVMSDSGDKECASLDEAINYVEAITIPIQLV